jgi:hypothetical protein
MEKIKLIFGDVIVLAFVFFLVCLSPFLTVYGILYLAAKENSAVWPDEMKSPNKPNAKIISGCAVATFLYYGFWFLVVTILKKFF